MEKVPIPQVPISDFLRNALDIVKNPLPFHHKNFEEKGDTFKLRLGFKKEVIFSRDAGLAEYVLQKNQRNYTKSKIQTEDLAKYVGKGLLTAEGDHWRRQRKLIQPAFHKKQLQGLLGIVKSAITDEYKRITPNRIIDIHPIFNDLAFQSVVKALFSSAVGRADIERLQLIMEAAQKMLVKELRQPYLGWWFRLSGKIRSHLQLTQEARDILKRIVNERRSSTEEFSYLLDMLLHSQYEDGRFMDEEQLIDEILILFSAGHETTSNALCFTFQLLALHPEWQERIYEEITAIDATDSDLMTTVMSSKICWQVIEESMRLYPPAYFIDRLSIDTDHYKGMRFDAGSNILLSVIEMHRNSALWENAEAFSPTRFENGSRAYSSQYFPFGAGPRKCIGNNFAMFEMVIALRELVSRYKIRPGFDSIEITPLITLKPKNAILLFEKR
jgi:cytochrome P450